MHPFGYKLPLQPYSSGEKKNLNVEGVGCNDQNVQYIPLNFSVIESAF